MSWCRLGQDSKWNSNVLTRIDVFHPPIEIMIELNEYEEEFIGQKTETVLDFKRCDFTGLRSRIQQVDWYELLQIHSSDNVDSVFERFYEFIISLFVSYVPKRKVKRNHYPIWYNKYLLNLKNIKSRAHKKFKRTQLDSDRISYISHRKRFETCQKTLFHKFVMNVESSIKTDPSEFWNYVNAKKYNQSLPNKMFLDDKESLSISKSM